MLLGDCQSRLALAKPESEEKPSEYFASHPVCLRCAWSGPSIGRRGMTGRAFLGISHSPLMGLNPIAASVEQPLQAAIAAARERVLGHDPELVVLVAPDHYNGFFNELMPPFCVGTQARAVGDFLSPAGDLNVDASAAEAMAAHLMEENFDIAVSRRMQVDHGFSQALQLLWGGLSTPPTIPVFVNAVAQPGIPRLRRCRALGEAIGRFLDQRSERTLLIGSGGLSHEPPVPTLAHPDPAVRERITVRRTPSPADRQAKTRRVMAAGRALAEGSPSMKAINPAWDGRWMDLLPQGSARLDELCAMSEQSIEQDAGMSAHESKTWLVGRSALGTARAVPCTFRHYQAIPEYIAGFGLMYLERPLP